MLSEVLWELAESGDGEVVTGGVSSIFGNEAELILELTCKGLHLGLWAASL